MTILQSACDPPEPILFNATVSPKGGRLIDDVTVYKCMDGYIPTGPIEFVCAIDIGLEYPVPFWKRLGDHICRGKIFLFISHP